MEILRQFSTGDDLTDAMVIAALSTATVWYIRSIIQIFRKRYYFLYTYRGYSNELNYIRIYNARGIRNALSSHLSSFPIRINMENFNLEEGYSELVIYYNFEIDGEFHRYILVQDTVFDMYYKDKTK